jgi:2-polyprenyl-6-methoxyphenol hydroxylase-like FAD-dependent oxidoreductase
MAKIAMVGGGIVASCTAMMLARDGHSVTVLERDPQPPPPGPGTAAWTDWERRGVNQFRQLHYLLPRFREVVEQELPALVPALLAEGALRWNAITDIPDVMTGGPQPGDERFANVTARRPVAESVVAGLTATTDGVTVRRGVGVKGLTSRPGPAGVVHVTGVVTDAGEEIEADLVVDAGGRRTVVPAWLRSIGSPGPVEDIADSGFVYYGRHYRSADGSIPPALGGLLQPYGSVSTLTLPADNGTWGLGIIASGQDAPLRALSDNATWERVWRSFPFVAHWIDAEPITDVAVMARIEDRERSYLVDGVPVATGVVPLGDAWACTNPSLGRGISIGALHGVALRDALRDVAPTEARELVLRWHDLTEERVRPYVTDTLTFDRHRLAEIEAGIDGRPYETDDPGWLLGQALEAAASSAPDLLRGLLEVASLLERGVTVLARPGMASRAIELSANAAPPPGPDRAELLAVVGGG